MSRLSAWAVTSVILLALAMWPMLNAGAAAEPRPGSAVGPAEAGRQLFVTGCSSCHGLDGRGTNRGPTLERSGAAAAYYYLSTGRMPLAADDQPKRKDPAYSPDQVELLTSYVASLGEGPAVPEIDSSAGDLAKGGVLYRASCAACHSAAGIGGALSYGGYAPPLTEAEPKQIAAAVRVGPGNMPLFGPETLSDEEVASVVRYVRFLQKAPTPGGGRLGGAGAIPEGFVGWVFGMGACLAATVWIGAKRTMRGRP